MDARRRRLIADGVAAGLIGSSLVAAFFLVVDQVAGRPPLHTAAFLGEALFSGLRDPSAVTIAVGPILAFNGFHVAAFLGFGFFGALLEYETERHPELWYLTVFVLVGAAAVSQVAVLALMTLIGSPLSAGSIVVASVLGAVGMAVYLVASHRSAVRAIREAQETRLGRVE